jgi:hypothetical protein
LNARRDEDEQFAARIRLAVVLEQPAQERNAVEQRVRELVVCSRLTKIPPMTVVMPSLTCTRVMARWVSMLSPPSGVCAPGEEFSSVICMMTVLAAVICGVTFSVSAASL